MSDTKYSILYPTLKSAHPQAESKPGGQIPMPTSRLANVTPGAKIDLQSTVDIFSRIEQNRSFLFRAAVFFVNLTTIFLYDLAFVLGKVLSKDPGLRIL